jgi:peptide/nickel transport system substrate-binding protein
MFTCQPKHIPSLLVGEITRLTKRLVGTVACHIRVVAEVVVAVVLVAMAALSPTAGAEAQTLRWASQGDLMTLDPHSHLDAFTHSINGQVYETLVQRDKQLNIVAGLATEWQQTGATGWRLKLRPNVKFHDGTSFSADDVVFSLKRAQELTSQYRLYALGIGEVKRVDALTIDVVLPQVNPIFLEYVSVIPIMSKEWSEKNHSTKPLDFKIKEEKFTSLNTNGTGPYILVSRQPDVKTVFKRNPNWWGKYDGNVVDVVYMPIKSDATRTAALISGEIDLVLDPAPQDLVRLRSAPTTKVIEGVENRVLFIGMDQGRNELLYSNLKGKNPFKELQVRKALYQAIDIEAIRSKLMRGQSFPTGAVMPSAKGSYDDPDLERRLPFDLSAAKVLMADAGYAQGFEVTLDCPNNRYINDEEICQSLAVMWSQLNLKVTVNAMPRAIYFGKMEKLDTSMYLLGWGSAVIDAESIMTPIYRSRGTGGVGDYNWGQFKNPKLDELVAASSREPDPKKREVMVKAAIQEHNAQVHHIPLHRQAVPWAMRRNVTPVHRADNRLEWQWVTVKPGS